MSLLMLSLFAFVLLSQSSDLTTQAEKTHWAQTGRYNEVLSLCDAFPKAFVGKVSCLRFGKTPEGRPMVALVASSDGTLTPQLIQKRKRPVIYFQGGIHAGEIDGKDAGFWFLRELLEGRVAQGALKKVTLLFLPVFNVDGHERFGKNHRVNQRGPVETGWRVTGHNLNLNRDYTKADAPEMEALIQLLNRFQPVLQADLHVTDGAKFEHDVAVMIEPSKAGAQNLRAHGLALQEALFRRLEENGHLPLPFYPSFREEGAPESGFAYGIAPPRFSNSYWAHRNRFGILVETHSWRDYPHRVKTTFHVLEGLTEWAAQQGVAWKKACDEADLADQTMTTPVVLKWKSTGSPQTLSFRGYAYSQEPSDVSGSTWLRYDERIPKVWNIPYFSEIKEETVVPMPEGYVVPPAHSEWMRKKLSLHGFQSVLIEKETPYPNAEVFVVERAEFSATPFEGRMRLKPHGRWKTQKIVAEKGALWVPARQSGRALLLQLLEPEGVDSFLQWGFFNAHFEPKEYMEPYVAEEVARQMLKNPATKAEFEEKLKKDKAFAQSPEARLDFFYRKHPSYDARFGVYPLFRVPRQGSATVVDTSPNGQ